MCMHIASTLLSQGNFFYKILVWDINKPNFHILKYAKKVDPNLYTKNKIMVEQGEPDEEISQTTGDTAVIGVDVLPQG